MVFLGDRAILETRENRIPFRKLMPYRKMQP